MINLQAFNNDVINCLLFFLRSHIRVLETTQQNIAALLMGLEYLINISYVDGTKNFKKQQRGTNKGIGLETVKQLASKARLFEGLGLSGEQCRDWWSQTRC
ncbi:protein EXPORTIN 1A-like [Prunus avium]|uniref:Protein EXPORTIN 1A-like n=1 Tax=Prunus avium TaxID=42229 RepID=A0A6P5TP89_PRUAV|nr:protein EXPORTIN 1A-like [Prunus avium]XP_021833441.1 protein EXPORTIN 1A-like [Prunus avium]